jgi:hypothetical protein
MSWSWRRTVGCVLAAVFLVGMALLCGWRWGDVAPRWAYLGAGLSIISAIAFTALIVAKADEVSEDT